MYGVLLLLPAPDELPPPEDKRRCINEPRQGAPKMSSMAVSS
jgi:hypothetical protein